MNINKLSQKTTAVTSLINSLQKPAINKIKAISQLNKTNTQISITFTIAITVTTAIIPTQTTKWCTILTQITILCICKINQTWQTLNPNNTTVQTRDIITQGTCSNQCIIRWTACKLFLQRREMNHPSQISTTSISSNLRSTNASRVLEFFQRVFKTKLIELTFHQQSGLSQRSQGK